MNHLIRTTFALAAGVFAVSALAATSDAPLSAAAQAAHAVAVAQSRLTHVRAAMPGVMQPKVMGTQPQPGMLMENPFRAYPPSCAADPLPTEATTPIYTARAPLFATNANGAGLLETVTITVWRLPCSSSGDATPYNSGGFANAITFMRIDRDNDANTTATPRFPLVQASQGTTTFADAASVIRLAIEPNTVISETPFDSAIFGSTTYVLENYPYLGSGYFTFSDAFTLRIDPQVQGVTPVDISIPAYAGTGSAVVPIDGHLSSAWYDPSHSGEGMVIQVVDGSDGTSYAVFAAWYTYDSLGLPYWLIAQGSIQPGATEMTNVPVYYATGGGFAGAFGASSTSHVWGTMSLSFPDCNTIDFSYSGATADQTGPAGSGTREWKRLVNVNGLACE